MELVTLVWLCKARYLEVVTLVWLYKARYLEVVTLEGYVKLDIWKW